MTCLSDSSAACSAAPIMFLLFGSTITLFEGALLIADNRSPTLGFIESPPSTMAIAPIPASSKNATMPSPAATAKTARFMPSVEPDESDTATSDRRFAAHSAVCSSMLLMSMLEIAPTDIPALNALPGSSM